MDKGQTVKIEPINPAGLHPSSSMSYAIKAGGFIFLSGVVALDKDGNVIGAGNPKAQAEACLDAIDLILREAGASLADAVRFTCFAVTKEAASAYIAARAKRVPGRPAATTVFVSGLLLPELELEIEVIAVASK